MNVGRGISWVGGIAAVAVMALVFGLAVLAGQQPAAAALDVAVPPAYRGLLSTAAAACPQVPVAVLAAQLQTESGFDPDAVSSAGALGIAQFMPATWSAWGRDVDGNGVASPFDPADAIDAQVRHMCDLHATATRSGIPGDPVALALAGYNAGWGAVTAARGVPPYPETRAYVARVLDLAAQLTATATGAGFGAAADTLARSGLPRANPRTSAAAIVWATAQAAGGPEVWYRRCLNFVAQAYGWSNAGTHYAIDHYTDAMPTHLRHPGDRNPPPGALLFWDTGQRAGHVALSVGNGLIATNDIDGPGRISIVPATAIEKRWGARYLGWAPPYFPRAG